MKKEVDVIRYRCIKDFEMDDGSIRFKKDRIYRGFHEDSNRYLYNDLDEKHTIGSGEWFRDHFEYSELKEKEMKNYDNLLEELSNIQDGMYKKGYLYQAIYKGDNKLHWKINIYFDDSSVNTFCLGQVSEVEYDEDLISEAIKQVREAIISDILTNIELTCGGVIKKELSACEKLEHVLKLSRMYRK